MDNLVPSDPVFLFLIFWQRSNRVIVCMSRNTNKDKMLNLVESEEETIHVGMWCKRWRFLWVRNALENKFTMYRLCVDYHFHQHDACSSIYICMMNTRVTIFSESKLSRVSSKICKYICWWNEPRRNVVCKVFVRVHSNQKWLADGVFSWYLFLHLCYIEGEDFFNVVLYYNTWKNIMDKEFTFH